MNDKNVGILTWHYYSNFGSALQAYALQTLISRLGFKVKIINYRNVKFGNPISFSNRLKNLLSQLPSVLRNSKYLRKYKLNSISFRRKYLDETRIFTGVDDVKHYIVGRFDTIVFGSDQIWAPNVFNPIYMGVGLTDNLIKISYAASIGLNYIPDNLVRTFKKQLPKFHAISVREDEGKVLLQSIGINPISVVLDPTLMLDRSAYSKLETPVSISDVPFVFCYFLNNNHSYKAAVVDYAYKHGLKVVGVSDCTSDKDWMQILDGLGPDQFLWLIDHADTIFTDSYHGSIFSLLYHKNLFILKRFSDSDTICQNSRIRRLCTLFNINNRLLDNQLPSNTQPIDYKYFETVLKKEREVSRKFIFQSLS